MRTGHTKQMEKLLFSVTVNTDKLLQAENDKWQTRSLVREGAPQKQDCNFQTATFRQEVISGHKFQSGLRTLTY
jgi:hypothetical protein